MRNPKKLIEFIKDKENKLAVVVIDMQPGEDLLDDVLEEDPIGYWFLVRNQRKILAICEKEDIPVVLLENEGCEKTIPRIAHAVSKVRRRAVIEKESGDGFFNTNLDAQLKEWDVETVLLMGIRGCACVLYTAEGGLFKNYKIATSNSVVDRLIRFWDHFTWFRSNTIFFEA